MHANNVAMKQDPDNTETKKGASDLLRRERQQALILNSLPVIFYSVALEQPMPTTWISEQITAITGYSPADFASSPDFWEIRLHPDDREQTIAAYRNVLHCGSVTVVYRWLCSDGT
jgi:PAS domain-containing protein